MTEKGKKKYLALKAYPPLPIVVDMMAMWVRGQTSVCGLSLANPMLLPQVLN